MVEWKEEKNASFISCYKQQEKHSINFKMRRRESVVITRLRLGLCGLKHWLGAPQVENVGR